MGMIINIDRALEQDATYNVLKLPLNQLLKDSQEQFEKENPIGLIFHTSTIDRFQETFVSTIGFDHAFTETHDFAVGPIFNTYDGFRATYRTRTFQGAFIITQQTLEDGNYRKVSDDASAFTKRWHGDIVEYAMASLLGGFTSAGYNWIGGDGTKTNLRLTSADTTDGKIDTETKNNLFEGVGSNGSGGHTTVAREGDTSKVIRQANLFKAASEINIVGSDAGRIPKLAALINEVITEMENYRDDNGKYAGVTGAKRIVCANNAALKAALSNALSLDCFKQGEATVPNVAYQRATLASTSYLNDIADKFTNAASSGTKQHMFFIVDDAYNASNHGPEMTERIPFTLEVTDLKRPKGIAYDGRQRFDINCASWRGIACVILPGETSGNLDSCYVNGVQVYPKAITLPATTIIETHANS